MNINEILGQKVPKGKVKGIVEADFYKLSLLKSGVKVDWSLWDEKYPGWDKDYILYVSLDEPSRGITFDDFLANYLEEPIELVREAYDSLPVYTYLALPYAALATLDEEEE